MGTAQIITEGFYREFNLQARNAVEYYQADNVFSSELDNPTTITGLPVVGGTIGDNIPVRSVRILRLLTFVEPYSAIYVVSGTTQFSGTIVGARGGSRSFRSVGHVNAPRFIKKAISFGSLGSLFEYTRVSDLVLPRIELRLVYTSVQSVAVSTVENFNSYNIGRRYKLTGSNVNFLFEGATYTTLANGQLRIEGQWYTTAPFLAIPAGTYAGMDVALPALSNLDEFVPNESTNPPSISAIPIEPRIPSGETYPF